MNKEQLKEKLLKEGITDEDVKYGNINPRSLENVLLETELMVDLDSSCEGFIVSYYSLKIDKTIILSYDLKSRTVGELAEDLFNYLQESNNLERILPDISVCAYI